MDFPEFVFKRLDGQLETRDYIAWAESLLMQDSQSPSIAELASCSWDAQADPQQVERLFQSCVIELDLALVEDWHAAFRKYASSICANMLLGVLTPSDCMTNMLSLSDDHNEPYISWIWIDLCRDLQPAQVRDRRHVFFNLCLDLENSDECIRRTAAQFISLCGMTLPQDFPWIWWCRQCGGIDGESTFTETAMRGCPMCGAPSALRNLRFFDNREKFIGRDSAID